jgi:chromosome segregation ATPase
MKHETAQEELHRSQLEQRRASQEASSLTKQVQQLQEQLKQESAEHKDREAALHLAQSGAQRQSEKEESTLKVPQSPKKQWGRRKSMPPSPQAPLVQQTPEADTEHTRQVQQQLEAVRGELVLAKAELRESREEMLEGISHSETTAPGQSTRSFMKEQHGLEQINELKEQLRCMEQKDENSQGEVINLRRELTQAQLDTQVATTKVTNLQAEVHRLTAQLEDSNQKEAKSRSELEVATTRATNVQAEIRRLSIQLEDSDQKETKFRGDLEIATTREANLQSEVQRLTGQLEDAETRMSQASKGWFEEAKQKDTELKRLQDLCTQLSADLACAEAQETRSRREASEHGVEELNRLRHENEEIRASLAKAQGEARVARVEMKRLQTQSEEVSRELDISRSQREAMVSELKRQNSIVEELKGHLKHALNSPSAGLDALHLVQEVEGRGNMWIDLRSGETKIKKPVMFEPRKSGESLVAEFLDPNVAEAVLADIAQLQLMFKVPLIIECHTSDIGKGLSSEEWQELAEERARLISTKLEERGVESRLIRASGRAGGRKSGTARPALDVRFQMFSES